MITLNNLYYSRLAKSGTSAGAIEGWNTRGRKTFDPKDIDPKGEIKPIGGNSRFYITGRVNGETGEIDGTNLSEFRDTVKRWREHPEYYFKGDPSDFAVYNLVEEDRETGKILAEYGGV